MAAVERFMVCTEIAELRRLIATERRAGLRIGCVPTMGALHRGHLSLIERARALSDFVVATIFVNPTQFAPHEDFRAYPRPLEADLAACRNAGVDIVYLPPLESLYPPDFCSWVTVDGLSDRFEGEFRPSHFRGVATIVLKLFNVVQPDVACFGQKDYQQQAVIRRMVRDLDVPVEVVTCPTIREPDGLALSSRNVYLNPTERRAGAILSRGLALASEQLQAPGADLPAIIENVRILFATEPLVAPDYVAIVDADSLEPLSEPSRRMTVLVAARVGPTRLIDNCIVELP